MSLAFSTRTVFIRQIPPPPPSTERMQIFLTAIYHNIGIQIKKKELTKTFMMISNFKNPLFSMVDGNLFQRGEC